MEGLFKAGKLMPGGGKKITYRKSKTASTSKAQISGLCMHSDFI